MSYTTVVLFFLTIILILITGNWGWMSSHVFANTTWGLYPKSFFENVLVEAHGTVLDLVFIGSLLFYFDQRRSRQNERKRLEEMLSDLQMYRAPDASYRVLGTIRRLLSLGIRNLHLSEMQLNNLRVVDIILEHSNCHAIVFTDSLLVDVRLERCECDAAIFAGAKLNHVEFNHCSFKRAKFHGAKLDGIDLRSCEIQGADFTGASLRSANFRGVDCKGLKLKDADLRSANFIDAKNLDPAAISSARIIKHLKTNDPAVMDIVKQSSSN
jgi:hypothetical protein